ncbi:hypothetical protein C8F04DRAFT_1335498 [Mycena alexandri]|uniref:Uncharacterized protein n=1 Tax=Mycena alexandri TaxID=1745969 RepID=A0AAD6X9E9_9AGAR|nr:hypothetical protein C8F04DRAFT_1335498 [Mycena alexandri]
MGILVLDIYMVELKAGPTGHPTLDVEHVRERRAPALVLGLSCGGSGASLQAGFSAFGEAGRGCVRRCGRMEGAVRVGHHWVRELSSVVRGARTRSSGRVKCFTCRCCERAGGNRAVGRGRGVVVRGRGSACACMRCGVWLPADTIAANPGAGAARVDVGQGGQRAWCVWSSASVVLRRTADAYVYALGCLLPTAMAQQFADEEGVLFTEASAKRWVVFVRFMLHAATRIFASSGYIRTHAYAYYAFFPFAYVVPVPGTVSGPRSQNDNESAQATSVFWVVPSRQTALPSQQIGLQADLAGLGLGLDPNPSSSPKQASLRGCQFARVQANLASQKVNSPTMALVDAMVQIVLDPPFFIAPNQQTWVNPLTGFPRFEQWNIPEAVKSTGGGHGQIRARFSTVEFTASGSIPDDAVLYLLGVFPPSRISPLTRHRARRAEQLGSVFIC